MSITYRKLAEGDLETFIRMRITQLREEGATEELDLVPALNDYYHRHMADGTFVSWLALDGEKIVGTSGMSFVEKPPYFGCPSGKIGLLSSMFTEPAYRGQGLATQIMTQILAEAKRLALDTVTLSASDMGKGIYEKLGFTVRHSKFTEMEWFPE